MKIKQENFEGLIYDLDRSMNKLICSFDKKISGKVSKIIANRISMEFFGPISSWGRYTGSEEIRGQKRYGVK